MIIPQAAWAIASNIREGDNPEYTIEDFRNAMPAFTPEIIYDAALQGYIDLANEIVQYARWGNLWREGMRLVIAHYCTLFLQQPHDVGMTEAEIVNAGKVQGSVTSKSVGGVSVSLDNSTAVSDLQGWGTWKLTTYGAQFAQLAKMVGKGGMFIP